MAYVRPQVTVDQNITVATTSLDRAQPAFIFGPNYQLYRYDNASEKQYTSIGSYDRNADENGKFSAYPKQIDLSMIDTGYTKLFGENVIVATSKELSAILIEKEMPNEYQINIAGGYTMLNLETEDYSKKLKVGDTVYVSYEQNKITESFVTSVVGVKYSAQPWHLDDSFSGSEYGSGDSDSEGQAGTLVRIADAIPLSYTGSTVEITIVDIKNGVEFSKKNLIESENDAKKWCWETTTEDVDGEKKSGVKVYSLNYNIGTNANPDYKHVLYADLYVTYRELLDSYTDTLHSLIGSSEVANMLGTVDPDNPLAMGVYMAALNAATDDGDEAPPVYFMAVPSDDLDGYNAVLNKATTTDKPYIFAPTTRDEAVLEAVRSHVLSMSAKDVKMWRIAAASAEIPSEVARLDNLSDAQGDEYYAKPITGGDGETYNMFQVVDKDGKPNTNMKFRSTLVKGDIVRWNFHTNKWGEDVYDSYTITKIVNNYTVRVEGKITVDGEEPDNKACSKVEIYHEYTDAETADLIASTSSAFATRRMLNVFPSVFSMDGVKMTGEFAACAVAGLVSATEPQQPITNVTVRGIDNIPLTYNTFNKTQLDTIAAGGTFIVAQDLPEDKVYVRHQITTAYPDGNLNTAELSITKNVDNISYQFADLFRPYYGKYNITNDLLATFESIALELISELGANNSVYGPQLIADNTELKYVKQNELLKDHVDIAITLGVPYPCNNIDIVLTV